MAYECQFPKWSGRPLGEITVGEQVVKVGFEYAELVEAQLCHGNADKTPDSLAEEAFDVIHACETLLRKLESLGYDIDAMHGKVIEKNRERGYYGKHSD